MEIVLHAQKITQAMGAIWKISNIFFIYIHNKNII